MRRSDAMERVEGELEGELESEVQTDRYTIGKGVYNQRYSRSLRSLSDIRAVVLQ